MKKLLTILILLISIACYSTNKYCSPSGNDANAGTIGSPYYSWEKCIKNLAAGDTGFARGGTYRTNKTIGVGNYPCDVRSLNGSSGAHIVFMAYPGELPVLNCDNIVETGFITAFYLGSCTYIDFYGIRVTGLTQNSGAYLREGMRIDLCNNITLTGCSWDHNEGPGVRITNTSSASSVYTFTNCDAYMNGDPINSGGGVYGNADGFDGNMGIITYNGCRAWWNSDDGFDVFYNDGLVTYNNCWSFWNGYVPGTFTDPGAQADGMGYKWGLTTSNLHGILKRVFNNCLSFENKKHGYDQNTAECVAQFYNCTSYSNGGYGWATNYAMGGNPNESNVVKNCISYLDVQGTILETTGTMTTNSWNVATPNGGSFASTNSTGMDGARQSNGTLPFLNFLRLANGSNQIDVGTNVGIPFNGSAPDLGAFEFGYNTKALFFKR